MRTLLQALAVLLLLVACRGLQASTKPADIAAQVDRLLAEERTAKSKGAPQPSEPKPAGDEVFLRRLSFDLIGQPPTPGQITAFALGTGAEKRRQAVERLLADPQFGQNWARYWRDVVFSRRSEDRSLVAATPMVVYLTERFNRGARWDEIAREFVTAIGDAQEAGNTALILAQMANPADTAAEVSRIFLGIQIQCAQCHNHPTDRWQRRQFHELAAYFPRIGVRPRVTDTSRSFEVVSLNREARRRAPGVQEPTKLEYYMPDLQHPESEGTLIRPAFFATSEKLPLGLDDLERRERLAKAMTSTTNHWFSKAFVNRVWTELVGPDFYDAVDDLGPDKPCGAPRTLDYLATRFVASGYNVKWLYRVITSTGAYDRGHRPASASGVAPPTCARRLRADQLFNTLASALEIDESTAAPRRRFRPRAMLESPRGRMNQFFGFDPSLRSDEVGTSLGQALWMMNAPELQNALEASSSSTALGRLVSGNADDRSVTTELYLRFLAREPSPAELATCMDHVRKAKDRSAGFEDIAWALVNSTDFLYRK